MAHRREDGSFRFSAAGAKAARRLVLEEVLARVGGELSSLGLRWMPIKGAYLLRAGLADHLPLRRIHDLDILLHANDFHRAAEHLETLPNVDAVPHRWPFEAVFEYSYGSFSVPVELHRLLNYPERFLLPPAELFQRGSPVEGDSNQVLPGPEDALLIAICHRLVHAAHSPPPRTYDELALVAALPGFSWERFWEAARATGVEGFVHYLLKQCERHTGLQASFPRKHPYAGALAHVPRIAAYGRLSSVFRRVFVELPFVRNPAGLVLRKLRTPRG